MLSALKQRLSAFGFEIQDDDDVLLIFALEKAEDTIKNNCALDCVPDALLNTAVDIAAGVFLSAKKTFAPLFFEGIDLDSAVKQIQVGDVNTVFASDSSKSPEQRLDAFINFLLDSGKDKFSLYRRLKW